MSKKIIAVLLSLSMVGAAVSIPVFADEAETAEMTETIVSEETEDDFYEAGIGIEDAGELLVDTEEALEYEEKSVYEEDPDIQLMEVTAEGTVGALSWSLDGNTLTISGEGKISDQTVSQHPWYKYRSSIVNVVIGDGVTRIGSYAFNGYSNLLSVSLGNNIESIGSYSFRSCTALSEIIFGREITSIGNYAFYGCNGFSEFIIPDSVTGVGTYAFYQCGNLKNMYIGRGITNISHSMLRKCGKLEKIYVPKSVTNIANYATHDSKALSDVYYEGSEDDWKQVGIGSYNAPLLSAYIYYDIPLPEFPAPNITTAPATPTPTPTPTTKPTPTPTPNKYVPVTGITLNKSYLIMSYGESVQLNATIIPNNATNKNIIWTSSNPSVAMVEEGLVIASTNTSEFSATITATTEDGNYIAQCNVLLPHGVGNLKGIKVTPPTNTIVTEGMALDVTGLVVEAVYDDDETEEVTDYTLSGYDKDKIGKQAITVTYEDFTEEFEITVEAKKPIGIMLSQKPGKRSYIQGENLETTGMIVTALYNNNTTEDISDYTVSGYNANTTGTQTITVTYNGFTTMFTVTVTPKAQPTGTVEAPKMSIASYIGGKTITLTTATDGASIYYTTDGSAPTSSSTLYTAPIEFTETQTLKAIAVKDNMNDSKAVSGKISVPTVEKPVSSHAAGQVDTGTIITLKSATSGATIYYTTEGTIPTTENTKYTGSIAITKDMTVKAIAVKDGCKTSDIYTVAYTIPYVVPDNATVSIGSVTAAAGDMVSVPVYIFVEENITDYRFSISFDNSAFEYASVTPADGVSSSDLFTSVNGNTVTVLYSGAEVESGEMCSINLNALSSAIDGEYDITVDKNNIKITTASNSNLDIDVADGSITLSGSTNSNLDKVSAEAVLTDKDGNDISNASNITDEVTANIVIDDVQEDAVSTAIIANVILAVYDRKGMLVSLSTVEADLTDINYVFSHTIEIPEDVSVGSIKMLIWNGLGDMTPLMAASSLI